MKQAISGFYLDEERHWIARLACGHGQHVRHDPPLVSRPWVLTVNGRASRLGQSLNCVLCDEEKTAMSMVESQVLVSFDAVRVKVMWPHETVQQVTWADLQKIIIQTDDSGPWGSDVWWVLTGTSNECHFPMGATGEKELLDRLQKLAGFDNKAVIQAMMSTGVAEFVCWQRGQGKG